MDVGLAADTVFPGVMAWFERTTAAAVVMDIKISGSISHLLGLLHDLQFLSATVAAGVQEAITLGAGLPGAGGGGGNTTNNNVTVNNNVPGTAAAIANGYALGASLRPGGV
jgi:hypothetical protein